MTMQVAKKIVELLTESPKPLDTKDIIEKIGVKNTVVNSTLNRMKREGKILATKGLVGPLMWTVSKSDSSTAASTPHVENGKAVELLRFMNEFFKANADFLFSNEQIAAFVGENSQKFEEVEKTCQA